MRHGCFRVLRARFHISIHAPRAGCDQAQMAITLSDGNFNPRTPCGVRLREVDINNDCPLISIHAPRAGCDGIASDHSPPTLIFQSTHPVRGATPTAAGTITVNAQFQSTHPVRGATPSHSGGVQADMTFQSTHPVRGATNFSRRFTTSRERFQSTHPVRGATQRERKPCADSHISIHAPRAGCDHAQREAYAVAPYFNPRTPCGVRLKLI